MKSMMTTLVLVIAIGSVVFGSALAGTLDPPGPPAPTMMTLQQVYDAAKPRPDTCFDNTGNRFVDCGNGTVKDTVTSLIWLKNANCFAEHDWAAANIAAAQLAHGQCGLTDGSAAGAWRLPTQQEWSEIMKSGCDPALPDRGGTGCYAGNPWASGVQSYFYWSSTTFDTPGWRHFAWGVYLNAAIIDVDVKWWPVYGWPVRSGQ